MHLISWLKNRYNFLEHTSTAMCENDYSENDRLDLHLESAWPVGILRSLPPEEQIWRHCLRKHTFHDKCHRREHESGVELPFNHWAGFE